MARKHERQKRYAADFETTTIAPARVWCWGVACVETPDIVETGRTIEEFIEWASEAHNPVIYFHNEKFDGAFILDYLLRSGFTWKKTKGECAEMDFTTIIDDMGKFYAIEIYWTRKGHKVKKCTIYDSYKIIPMSVEKAAKDFGLKLQKLHIDYDRHNTECDITAEEWEYLRVDVSIMAQVLQIAFQYELTKITLAACCLANYRDSIGAECFKARFPSPPRDVDAEIRKAYKGGWTYANPENTGRDVGAGLVLDVNSLYPAQMAYRQLPYGKPLTFTGKYTPDEKFPLYIQRFSCIFRLKKNKLPMIQLKGNGLFCDTEYLTDSGGMEIMLTLASPDIELFFAHYDVEEIQYFGGWKFRASDTLFRAWVEKWAAVKIEASKAGNKALRTISKLYQNSLYGKFAKNPKRRSKRPVYNADEKRVQYEVIKTMCTNADGTPQRDKDGKIVYVDYEEVKPLYIPVAVFITAWARYTTITVAQKIHEESIAKTGKSRFCYADTDSVHIIGTEIPDCIEVDAYKLGAWKLESEFTHAKFLQAKRYVEVIDGELQIKCAGLPANCHAQVTFENFEYGTVYTGKLTPKTVEGGVILEETTYNLGKKE